MRYLRYLPPSAWTFLAGLLIGIVLGVVLYGWLRGIVTVLFFVGLIGLAVWIWVYFENQKKKP